MKMAYNIKVKNGIAFNLDDEFQNEQYNHICKIPNVSSYIKRLIAMDMAGTWRTSEVLEDEFTNNTMSSEGMMLSLL